MNVDKLYNRYIPTAELFYKSYSDRIEYDKKNMLDGMNEINSTNPKEISTHELRLSLIFLKDNLLKLDYIKNNHCESNDVKFLRAKLIETFNNLYDENESIRKKFKDLNEWNALFDLGVVLEATNEFDLLKKFKIKNKGSKLNEFRSNLLYELSEHYASDLNIGLKKSTDKLWRFSNDIYGFKKENTTFEKIIKEFLVKNNLKIKDDYLKSVVWFKCAIDLNMINPSIQNLKEFYSKLITKRHPYEFVDFENLSNKSEIFFEIFVKTNVFKNSVAIRKDLNKACLDLFKDEIENSANPSFAKEAINSSKTLLKEFVKNKVGSDKLEVRPIVKKNKI